MNRLPKSCKNALIQHHSTAHQIWSLNRLVDLGIEFSERIEVKQKTADVLLRDVKLRLARQHALCLAMKDSIFNGSTIGKINCGMNGTNADSPRIIQASIDTAFVPPAELLKQNNNSKKVLDDLEAMHADTYRLIWQLYSNNDDKYKDNSLPNIINNFSSANQSLVCSIFEQIRSRHAHSIDSLAQLVVSQRIINSRSNNHLMEQCSSFLKGRLGIQLLCDHYVGLHKQASAKRKRPTISRQLSKRIGSIGIDCNIWNVIKDAVSEASGICDTNLSIAPDVCVWMDSDMDLNELPFKGRDITALGEHNLSAPPVNLVKSWVHHCLVEILKNAMQASVRRDPLASTPVLVNVRVVHIQTERSANDEFLQVCIRDYGVGLSDDGIKKSLEFATSNTHLSQNSSVKRIKLWDRLNHQQSYAAVTTPLSGLGVGLPISQGMMRLFGGDLKLCNERDGGGLLVKLLLPLNYTLLEQ